MFYTSSSKYLSPDRSVNRSDRRHLGRRLLGGTVALALAAVTGMEAKIDSNQAEKFDQQITRRHKAGKAIASLIGDGKAIVTTDRKRIIINDPIVNDDGTVARQTGDVNNPFTAYSKGEPSPSGEVERIVLYYDGKDISPLEADQLAEPINLSAAPSTDRPGYLEATDDHAGSIIGLSSVKPLPHQP